MLIISAGKITEIKLKHTITKAEMKITFEIIKWYVIVEDFHCQEFLHLQNQVLV